VLLIPWVGTPSVWLGQGDLLAVAAAGTGLLALVRLAGFASDPAYDPWAGAERVVPAQVLLQGHKRLGHHDRPDGPDPGCLLPPEVALLVAERLAGQADATGRRHRDLARALT
jgi:hypothetical protein